MDEIARLRAEGDTFVAGFEKMHAICGYTEYRLNAYYVVALIAERRALLAALEQAQKERDEARETTVLGEQINDLMSRLSTCDAERAVAIAQRDQAQNTNEFGLRALQTVEAQRDQAMKERDISNSLLLAADAAIGDLTAQRDQAQKEAKDASALLEEAWEHVVSPPKNLRARIEAMLEKKP